MHDDSHTSQNFIVRVTFGNGLNLEISVPVSVLKHILVALGQEEVIPGWLVHLLLVSAQAEES